MFNRNVESKAIVSLAGHMADLPSASAVLFDSADVSLTGTDVFRSLPDAVVASAPSLPAAKAAAVVLAATSQSALLSVIARERRASVLKAVARNRLCQGHVRDALWLRTLKVGRSELASDLMNLVSVAAFVDAADDLAAFLVSDPGHHPEDFPWLCRAFAARVVESRDADEVRLALSQTTVGLLAASVAGRLPTEVCCAAAGVRPATTQEEALDVLGEERAAAFADELFHAACTNRKGAVSMKLAENFAVHGSWENVLSRYLDIGTIHLLSGDVTTQQWDVFEFLTASAAGNPQVWNWLMRIARYSLSRSDDQPEQQGRNVNRLLDLYFHERFGRFAGADGASDWEDFKRNFADPLKPVLSGGDLVGLAAEHADVAGTWPHSYLRNIARLLPADLAEQAEQMAEELVYEYARKWRTDLPAATVVVDDDLRFRVLDVNPKLLRFWFRGRLGSQPEPGQLTCWVNDTGGDIGKREQRVASVASALSGARFDGAVKPWMEEAVDLLGTRTFDAVGNSSLVAGVIVAKARKLFGDDAEAWRLFWSMRDQLNVRPFGDVVDAVAQLTGVQPDGG